MRETFQQLTIHCTRRATGLTWNWTIGYLPGRSSVCLYRETLDRITPYAYFQSEAKATEFMELLEEMYGGMHKDVRIVNTCPS